MPLPILHSFVGYHLYQYIKREDAVLNWKVIAFTLFAANAADLDFIPGILLGETAGFHREFSHSIFAGILFGLIAGIIYYLIKHHSFFKVALFSTAAYLSHILLDYFNGPNGLPIFWPLSSVRFGWPVNLFPGHGPIFTNTSGFSGFFASLFSPVLFGRASFELFLVFIVSFVLKVSSATRLRTRVSQAAMMEFVFAFFFLWFSIQS